MVCFVYMCVKLKSLIECSSICKNCGLVLLVKCRGKKSTSASVANKDNRLRSNDNYSMRRLFHAS